MSKINNTPVKTRLKKNDTVQVVSGKGAAGLKHRIEKGGDAKDRAQRGKVIGLNFAKGTVLVQGVKEVTKTQRTKQEQGPKERFIKVESPVNLSNVMLVCPECDEATRIGIRTEKVEREGGKVKVRRIRVCKRCGKDIP